MAVFFSHITRDSLSAGNSAVLFLGQFGQEGVAIFFVISGIVIAFVAREKEHDLRSYIVARLGRLWSVIVPALILTVVLDVVGRSISPEMYASSAIQAWGWDLASAWNFFAPLFFLNQTIFPAADPGTNGPFWSLCYEFWYYILFGIAYYVRGFARIALLVIAAVITGPKILALFPIWAFGLIVYRCMRQAPSALLRTSVWAASSVALIALMVMKYKIGAFAASVFPVSGLSSTDVAIGISHFAVGAVCAVNIAAYDHSGGLAILRTKPVEGAIRFLAARSFSLYLYQAPCLFFFGALTYGMSSSLLRLALVILLSLLTILLLAELTEKRKKAFSAFVERIIPANIYGFPGWKGNNVVLKSEGTSGLKQGM